MPTWYPPPQSLKLDGDEVHVWRACLDQTTSRIDRLYTVLSPDERERAGRFYFQRDREHYIVARGVLRMILGRYLEIQPDRVRFCYSPYGKPSLVDEDGGDLLRFNLSHSGGLVLYAVACDRELGIDIECIRDDLADKEIADRFFSAAEVAVLQTLARDVWSQAFFNCWTRKEAYIKALGEGLSHPLHEFDVSLVPGEPAALLSTRRDPKEASCWSLRELETGAGYVAALAVKGHDWRLKCWQWPDE
jgi:4'-phosphopantetheinyl transferase